MASNKVEIIIDGKNKAKGALDQANRQLGSLSDEAKAAGAAIAGALSVGVFANWIQGSIDAADAASKSAASTGMAVEEYTALKYAAELAGIGVEELDGALTKFNRTIDQAAGGGEKQLAAFDRVGVSITNASGQLKSNDQLLAEVADRFQAMPDGIQKTAMAMELFGKSGAKLIPLLNGGAEGLAELKAEAEKLGVVISGEQAAQSEVFNDNITRLGQAGQGAANQIAGEMLPTLVELSELLVDVNKNTEASSVVATAFAGVLKVLATAAIILGDAFGSVGRFIGGAAAAAMSAAQGKFSEAADIMRQVGEDNARATSEAAKRIEKLWDGSGEAAAKAATEQKEIQLKIETDLKAHIDQVGDLQKQQVREANEALRERVAAERAATAEVAKLKKEQLETEKRYNEFRAKLSGAGAGSATYGQAQDLKIQARQALKAGDYEGARRSAQAALEVLSKLQDAGENTYGFQGFADELQAIEQNAERISLENAQKTAATATAEVQKLKNLIDSIKDVKLTIKTSDEELAGLKTKMQQLAAEIGQTLVIPIQVQPVSSGLPVNTTPGDPDVPMPALASGGHVRGPGTGTSDSILARLSNGEFVVKAAAVRKYGVNMLNQLNGMHYKPPGYAMGGLVSGLKPSAPQPFGTINLSLDGQSYTMQAGEQDFASLVRRQRMKRGSTR